MLTGCHPACLTFMNSWRQDFADGGFFLVEDQSVLNRTRFFDINWHEDDLTQSEKEAYKTEGTERALEYAKRFSSIGKLPHQCPICHANSKVEEFSYVRS